MWCTLCEYALGVIVFAVCSAPSEIYSHTLCCASLRLPRGGRQPSKYIYVHAPTPATTQIGFNFCCELFARIAMFQLLRHYFNYKTYECDVPELICISTARVITLSEINCNVWLRVTICESHRNIFVLRLIWLNFYSSEFISLYANSSTELLRRLHKH